VFSSNIKKADDVGVIQCRNCACFPFESGPPILVFSQTFAEYLDGNIAIQAFVGFCRKCKAVSQNLPLTFSPGYAAIPRVCLMKRTWPTTSPLANHRT